MTAALNPEAIAKLGFWFALAPIAVGTCVLVIIATVYARITGRHYPFRQFDDPSNNQTEDETSSERLGLSEEELAGLLERYRHSFNLGVEDLARLIGAAELQAATHVTAPLTAKDVMSSSLITVGPETTLGEVADLFKNHRFTSLPVVGANEKFLGVIFQMHLIRQAREDALRLKRGFFPTLSRLLDSNREIPVTAGDIMEAASPCVTTSSPLGVLLPMMAVEDVDAVPVLDHGRIVGVVTRTDLIAVLARTAVRSG